MEKYDICADCLAGPAKECNNKSDMIDLGREPFLNPDYNIITSCSLIAEEKKVDSSMIDSVAYVEDTRKCFVKFKNGSVYLYPKMDKKVFEKFLTADNTGKHFIRVIQPNFEAVKIRGEVINNE